MVTIDLLKSGPFVRTYENRDQVYDVIASGDSFVCRVPEPLTPHFSGCYQTELEAWVAIIKVRAAFPSATLWSVGDKDRCANCLLEDFEKQTIADGCITADWLIFKDGTAGLDIVCWFTYEFLKPAMLIW